MARADLVRRAGTSVMVPGSAERWFAPGFTDRQPAVADALLTSLTETARESYALACEALASFDVRDRVGNTRVPLLVAAGQHDRVVPPEQARSGVPDAFAVIPGCGQLRAEVRAHVPHDLLHPLQVSGTEYLVPVFGDENQVGMQDEDTMPASADVLY